MNQKPNLIGEAIAEYRRRQAQSGEMATAAAKEREESEIVKALRPVNLDPDREQDYERFFYPSKRNYLTPVLESLADVTANINLFFYFMRNVMERANYISGLDQEAQNEYVNDLLNSAFGRKVEAAKVKDNVVSYLRAIRASKDTFHQLYRSQRYADGVDIVLIGTGDDKGSTENPVFLGSGDMPLKNNFLPNGPSHNDWTPVSLARRGKWQSPVGQNVVKAANEINQFLFGTSAISERTQHKGLSVNTKFSGIQQIFEAATGFQLKMELVTDLFNDSDLAEQFLQVEMLRIPSEQARNIAEDSYGDARQRTDAPLPETRGRVDASLNDPDSKRLAPEAEALNIVVRSTVRFTLEKDIANFISQSEDRPNLSRVNSWFTIYVGQFLQAKPQRASVRKNRAEISNAQTMQYDDIPRYTMSASTLKKLSDIRAANGFVVEKTKGNPEGLYVAPSGAIAARPDIEAFKSSKLAEEHENLSEEMLEILGRNDISYAAYQENPKPVQWPHVPESDMLRLEEINERLGEFEGVLLGYDWDFGVAIYGSHTPGATRTIQENGSVTPDALSVADYLGYNLARDGEQPMVRNFANTMYMLARDQASASRAAIDSQRMYGSAENPGQFAGSEIMDKAILPLYVQLAYAENKAPKLEEIVKNAMKVLGYTALPTDRQKFDYSDVYHDRMREDGTPVRVNNPASVRGFIMTMLTSAMTAAKGGPGTFLWNETAMSLKGTSGQSPTSFEVEEELENHPQYFNSSRSPTAHFGRLYNYLGGQIFKQVIDAINAIPPADYLNYTNGTEKGADFGVNPYNNTVRSTGDVKKVPNNIILKHVLPYTLMLGKYVPNHETIYAQADEYVESIRPTEGFSEEEIRVPGLVNDPNSPRAVFPHQRDTQAYLRKEVPPPFAILALEPGGGKTGQGVIDMTCMAVDMLETGERVKPLVICPNGLVGTWCADIKYFLGNNWNAFPITADVMKRWGPDRLAQFALSAPPNTIFITSMTFIQGRNNKLCIGNARLNVSENMEFIRRLNCNYVAIDESHNLKNFGKARHEAVKTLTTSTRVKWLRLLTGTIMPDRAKDIEGQIALYSPLIFRAGEIANIRTEDNDVEAVDIDINGVKIATYTPLNAKRAVDKLMHYAAFIVKKRKEWAWMLPAPIERFIPVDMVGNEENTDAEELELQKLHQELYETVLKMTLEAIEELLKQQAKALADGEGDDDADPLGDGAPAGLLEQNLARFERLIIAPQYDPSFKDVFKDKGANFKSRKAKRVAQLAYEHFHTQKWNRNGMYLGDKGPRPLQEYDLVEHDGDLYVATKYDKDRPEFVQLPKSTIGIPPSENPDYWKKEPRGKLIIITRYNNSASAIYDALLPEQKAVAVKFTGDEKSDKQKAFNAFKTDPNVQILIANEQGMSEGHNLQMASRMIRCESPWGPGALNQTSARIFRPDPKGALNGVMARDVIYLDWILADNTMEVPKLARVISKQFQIQRFTESDNPRYADVFREHHVPSDTEEPLLSLGVDMLKNISGLRDEPFIDMVYAYQAMNRVENQEFKEMRQTQEARMLEIVALPNIDGAQEMEVKPFVGNQDIPDPRGWSPTTVETLMRNPEVAKDFESLVGSPAITEFGTGKIVRFNMKKGVTPPEPSSCKVRLKNPPPGVDEILTVPLNLTYVASGIISPADMAKYFDVPMAYTQADVRKAAREEQEAERQREEQEEKEAQERKIAERKSREVARVVKKERADGEKRAENEKKGKPLNDGVYKVEDASAPLPVPTPAGKKVVVSEENPNIAAVVSTNAEVRVTPAYYHGFATLEAEFDEAEVNLKKLGFINMGPYVFIETSNKKKFHAFYAWLDENFDLSDRTVKMIEGINTAFEKGTTSTHKLWYKMELAPINELPSFFNTRKKVVENRREVRVFPVFMENHVLLCIDLRTNPAVHKWVGKAIPGTGAKLKKSDGHWFYFGKGKTDLREMIANISRNGYTVVNKKEALKELTEINFKTRKPS